MKPIWIRLSMVLALVSAVIVVGYAAQQLSINNTGSVSNINTNMFMVFGGVTSTTTCGAGTGTYTDTNLALVWNVPVGGSQTQYGCLQNTGSGTDTLVFSASGLPAGVTFSGSSNPATVASGGYALVTFTVTDTLTTNADTALAFTITVQ